MYALPNTELEPVIPTLPLRIGSVFLRYRISAGSAFPAAPDYLASPALPAWGVRPGAIRPA